MYPYSSRRVQRRQTELAWLATFSIAMLAMVLALGVFGLGLPGSVGLVIALVVFTAEVLLVLAMTGEARRFLNAFLSRSETE